jgi:hypothetical protein
MWSAFVATLDHPAWWPMALAAFLVRGGILLILLPIVTLPTTAALFTTFSSPLETLILGRPSLGGVLGAAVVITFLLVAVVAAGLAGSWLDLALMREAAEDEDVDLQWAPRSASVREAFAIRLTAHLPTLVALGYAFIRVVGLAYEELTSPGDTSLPVETRVVARAPDVVLVVLGAWLAGETVGALAARRAAAGWPFARAMRVSIRQLASARGLATLALTGGVLVGLWLPFLLAAGRAWEHLRGYLFDGAQPVLLAAALTLLAATWTLGLAVTGAGLAWRATAWTAEVGPPQAGAGG